MLLCKVYFDFYLTPFDMYTLLTSFQPSPSDPSSCWKLFTEADLVSSTIPGVNLLTFL